MHIQPVTNQPNYKGKLVIRSGASSLANDTVLGSKFKQIASMIQDKPYDIFLFQNKQNPDFYNIAANKSLKDARQVKEYTVTVQKDIMPTSIIDAAKDAMNMYEKFIAKGIKR